MAATGWVGSNTKPTVFSGQQFKKNEKTSPTSKQATNGKGCCCGACAQKNLPFNRKK